jgi:predicted O-methyltransferase YrrM
MVRPHESAIYWQKGNHMSSKFLDELFASQVARNADNNPVQLHSALGREAASKVSELVTSYEVKESLEIGMAMGVSAVAMLGAGSRVTSIDPFQNVRGGEGWGGVGIQTVKRAGFEGNHELLEEPSHQALPRLLVEGKKYDLILIDGWHSFDFVMVDVFYADLLLRDGGILILDDVEMASVNLVSDFIDTHKPYTPLRGSVRTTIDPINILRRKFVRPSEWGSIRAWRKVKSSRVRWNFFETEFYPSFKLYKWWMRLRGRKIQPPNL